MTFFFLLKGLPILPHLETNSLTLIQNLERYKFCIVYYSCMRKTISFSYSVISAFEKYTVLSCYHAVATSCRLKQMYRLSNALKYIAYTCVEYLLSGSVTRFFGNFLFMNRTPIAP